MAPLIPNHLHERFVQFNLNQVYQRISKAIEAFQSPIISRGTLYRILSGFEERDSFKLEPQTDRRGSKKARQNAQRVHAKLEMDPDITT